MLEHEIISKIAEAYTKAMYEDGDLRAFVLKLASAGCSTTQIAAALESIEAPWPITPFKSH